MATAQNPNKAKLMGIYDRYFDLLWSENAIACDYISYDIVKQIDESGWPSMAGEIVRGQLQEILNGINQFHSKINQLDAWSRLLPELQEADSKSLTISYVSTIGFFCLNQPYSLKERVINAATQIIHQGNRAVDKAYLDHLATDATSLVKTKWPTKSDKRKALLAVGQGAWAAFPAFVKSLDAMNSKKFERETMFYRTSANHFIPPSFEFGFGPLVSRFLTPKCEMKPNSDGTFRLVAHPESPVPAYGFGGLPPIKVADVVTSCVEQHAAAKACYFCLEAVVGEIVAKAKTQQ